MIEAPPAGYEYRVTLSGSRLHLVATAEAGAYLAACGADTTLGAGGDWVAEYGAEFPVCSRCARRTRER